MKKIISGALVASALLVVPTFASTEPVLEIMPISAPIIKNTQVDNNEIIIRNNKIESDYEYNSIHYYTSKMEVKEIVIPEDIKKEAKKVYFLVEEGVSRIYYAKSAIMEDSIQNVDVKKEYNYKVVDYIENKKEYIFDNKDLVKDFGEDKYTNVNITLMAELENGKKMPLSNSIYLTVNNKQNTLARLADKQDNKKRYFGYYNTNELEKYLEKLAEKKSRSEYKNMLSSADTKINKTLDKNEDLLKDNLNKIKKELDFKKYIGNYITYKETKSLLSNLGEAVNNQLQNIRAYDAIDKIFK